MFKIRTLVFAMIVSIFASVALVFQPPVATGVQAEPPALQPATETRLTASLPVAAAAFGSEVAIDGATAVVGAPKDNGVSPASGAAYVFRYDGTSWIEQAKLTASDGEPGDFFGRAVAISGNTIVVGANGDDDFGFNSGAAYVFQDNGTAWVEVARLRPSSRRDVYLGWSVAISGDTIVAGAPYSFRYGELVNAGSAYIFQASATGWAETARLSTNRTGGATQSDMFGWSVAVSEGTVVVGAYLDDTAYVFTNTRGGWTRSARLSGSDTVANDRFGWSVAIDGATIVVGAIQHNTSGKNAGAAYVFSNSGAGWGEVTKLVPGAGQIGSRLGWSVAIDDTTILVGARESKGRADRDEAGAAYVFTFDGTNWTSAPTLYASAAEPFDHFGASVAISGATALVGAPADFEATTRSGTAYVYPLR